MDSIQTSLDIAICRDAQEAREKGFVYSEPEYEPIQIAKVVVVRNGTVGGNDTVDLVLCDERGQKYVCMITGALIKSIPVDIGMMALKARGN